MGECELFIFCVSAVSLVFVNSGIKKIVEVPKD